MRVPGKNVYQKGFEKKDVFSENLGMGTTLPGRL
jgi:hypothetical protein